VAAPAAADPIGGRPCSEEVSMYISRLAFAALPGHCHQVEEKLQRLRDLVVAAGGKHVRVLRTHFASLGSPDLVFEQEVVDLVTLEHEIEDVVAKTEFQTLSRDISGLLAGTPKREVYEVL
jgi:hypothetical protein